MNRRLLALVVALWFTGASTPVAAERVPCTATADYVVRKMEGWRVLIHPDLRKEATEAFFGTNDFYPFVRAELKVHDPAMYELLEKVWEKKERSPPK